MKRGFNDYRVVGDVVYLALTNRKGETVAETMIDVADLGLVLAYGRRWSIARDKRTSYAVHIKPSQALHRLLLPGSEQVDHINSNGLDNRRANIRSCTRAENLRNSQRPLNNSSGYKGVYWQKAAGKWHAHIRKDNETHYLGLFDNLEEAARAYDAAARVLHGEFARLNFPDDTQPVLLRRPA